MMRVMLLALSALLNAGKTANQTATRCTNRACFTFHKDKLSFEDASQSCIHNGGHLITIRNVSELEDVKAILSISGETTVAKKVWIGLRLQKGSCVISGDMLRGFRWTSGSSALGFSNWNKEPRSTCTEDRCVSIHTSSKQLKWNDGSCKDSAWFVCKFNIKGTCKPVLLAGAGKVEYMVPFSNVTLQQGGVLTLLPHGTFAEVSCAETEERHYSICKETGSLFVWEKPGPFCASDKRSCRDQNGGCDQLCVENDSGEVHCQCREGYYLKDDKMNCLSKDTCHESACEHKCSPKPTGFLCICPEGFELSENNFNCIDVDECRQNVCEGHLCHNTEGSYKCECKKGYKNVGGTCEDVDECAESICGPYAHCLNSYGSFSCDCAPGFRKSSDSDECIDKDECAYFPCEQTCNNTIGSFTCSCYANFNLADNGISCVADTKQTIHNVSSHEEEVKKEETGHHVFDQSLSTLGPPITNEIIVDKNSSVHKFSWFGNSWVLVYVLGSVVPLLLLIALTSVIAIHRWNRSRKKAKKKNATADSYCWVSSGFTTQLETEQN